MFQIFIMVSSHSKFPLEGRSPSFLRKLFRWVLISLSQSLSSKLCLGEHTGGWQRKRRDGVARCSCRDITLGWTLCMRIHFFLSAFCADFVTFPPEVAFFSTDLMTPTATVCLMSRTAKRPEQGKILHEKKQVEPKDKSIGNTKILKVKRTPPPGNYFNFATK